MRICLICNHILLTVAFRDFLRDLGHQVFPVVSGVGQMDAPERCPGPVDLVISDQPAGNGTVRAWTEKLHGGYPDTPIVLLTDRCPSLSKDEALANGVFSYLRKPISFNELELLLARVEESRARRRQPEEDNGR